MIREKTLTGKKNVSSRTGYHTGKRPQKAWEDPHQFDGRPLEYILLFNKIRDSKTFAEALRIVLEEYAGITQAELSRKTGISVKTIEGYLAGRNKPDEYRNLYAISIAINLKPTLLKELIGFAGLDTIYMRGTAGIYQAIFEVSSGLSLEEVNNLCRVSNVPMLFDLSVDI